MLHRLPAHSARDVISYVDSIAAALRRCCYDCAYHMEHGYDASDCDVTACAARSSFVTLAFIDNEATRVMRETGPENVDPDNVADEQ